MTEFGFGMTNVTNATEDYRSLMNDNVEIYGVSANTTRLALDFRGLGLPSDSYAKFANLLAVATKGESSCVTGVGAYCVLSRPCAEYQASGLWDYTFKVMFDGSTSYLRVPLATFAANSDIEGGVCVIYAEYLNPSYQDSQSIIFGGMFFQSVYAQYTMTGVNSISVDLFTNLNALSTSYLGSQAY